jgi:hypothetical protein
VTVINSSGNTVGTTTTESNGTYTVGNLRAGTFRVFARETVNGTPVRVDTVPFTITNANVVDENLTLPTATDLTGVTTPSSNNSGLVIFARDQNQQPVEASATVSGMAGTFGPASPIIINAVPTTTHTVTVTGNGQVVTIPGVTFTRGAVTVLFVTLESTPPVGNATVSGTAQLLDGTPVAGITLQLWSNGASVQEKTTNDSGNFEFTDVAAGDYTIVNQQTLAGYNTVAFTQPITVTAGTNITGLKVIVPTEAELVNAAAPSTEDATLVILGINENTQLVPIVAQVSGNDTTFGPMTALAINHVDPGTHTVQAQATSTGSTITVQNVPIPANTITVLTLTFAGATP